MMNAPRSAFGASPHWGAHPAAGQSPFRGCAPQWGEAPKALRGAFIQSEVMLARAAMARIKGSSLLISSFTAAELP